jgi:5'-deoxynucleotidase YfbR-like HD superfamily hydrolase
MGENRMAARADRGAGLTHAMATKPKMPARAWQRMLSGRRLDLIDPSPLDVEIEDIAHGLARVARWNGQTRGEHAFSVAQHSLLVLHIIRNTEPDASPEALMMALLHDAPEYVIGDMISPFKAVIGGDYKNVEGRLLSAIHLRFGLPAATPSAWKTAIKRADAIAAWFEATRLAGFTAGEAEKFFPHASGFEPDAGLIEPMPSKAAQAGFLDAFMQLEQSRSATKRRG